jgi:chemotaxis methyl-accepting protein methylase
VKSGENTNEIVDAFYIYETEFQKNQEKLKELRNP